MFKEIFNNLAVEIETFILDEHQKPIFDNSASEINYYHDIVDRYNIIETTLVGIINSIEMTVDKILYQEAKEYNAKLNAAFEKYKTNSIVKYYIMEIMNSTKKDSFFKILYAFEKKIVRNPLELISENDIQTIIDSAKEFSRNATNFYFFTNNPYVIDPKYNVIIPHKYTYETEEKLIDGLFSYLNNIYNSYKTINYNEINEFYNFEKMLTERVFELENRVNEIIRNKFEIIESTTSIELFNYIGIITGEIDTLKNNIYDIGVYRISLLSDRVTDIIARFDKFVETYKFLDLYNDYNNSFKFTEYLTKLQEYIYLIEDGKINLSKDYVLTELSLKELVDNIVKLSKTYKRSIKYIQKYNSTGKDLELIFEFYQTDQFLDSIKKYYYDLVTNKQGRITSITIDQFGDNTINNHREQFKSDLANYEHYLTQEISFMDLYEVNIYQSNLILMQEVLKKSALVFIDASIKTSSELFRSYIETYYNSLLSKMKDDLNKVKNKYDLVIIENEDPTRKEALVKLRNIETQITNLNNIIKLSKRYAVINFTNFITTNIFEKYNSFYLILKDLFSKNSYSELLNKYELFYNSHIFDFNMLLSLEKLSSSSEFFFSKVDLLNSYYIDEQMTSNIPSDPTNLINFITDMFDDETFKSIRNDLHTKLDDFYGYMISKRENENIFLLNEKNIKKIYIDNQLMKLNYIRLYDKILKINSRYSKISDISALSEYEWFTDKEAILQFNYIKKLEKLILNQNRILADISKIIAEYKDDNNYLKNGSNLDIIKSIETYNITIESDIKAYISIFDKIENMLEYEKLRKKLTNSIDIHLTQWKSIIFNNHIKEHNSVSYNEGSIIKGNIPFTILLDAKIEINHQGLTPEFIWDFGEEVIKTGSKVNHTFYTIGTKNVRCEMKYSSGEVSTRFLKFEIGAPVNSQIVKSGITNYIPLTETIKQPKITYIDSVTNLQVTVPITVTGNIPDMITSGKITINADKGPLLVEKIGLVVLGFNGVGLVGAPFDYKTIFSDTFVMPKEAEFLFDFKVSDPIVNKSIIDISDSKFIEYIAKVPKEKAKSIYEIDDASTFNRIDGNNIEVIQGDILIMKNKSGRFAAVRVAKIREITLPEDKKYYFEIDFEYYVNVSLNSYEKTVFKPLNTSITVPTVVFKTNVRELFTTLVTRIEDIKKLKMTLSQGKDTESVIVIKSKIKHLETLNKQFYIYGELDRLKAKSNTLHSYYSGMMDICNVGYSETCSEDINNKNLLFGTQIDNSKSFEEYMNSINGYDFRTSIVDAHILGNLYDEQVKATELLIDTYNFNALDITYYINTYNKLKYINKLDIGMMDSKIYTKQMIKIVKLVREYLFKIKLIINFPIMSSEKYIQFSTPFKRLAKDELTNSLKSGNESDFYLLNKKLELQYGFEISKIEEGMKYTSLIETIINKSKEKFGNGLSEDEINILGNYIQAVESDAIDEYDDFFMIPFWIDYLDKLN